MIHRQERETVDDDDNNGQRGGKKLLENKIQNKTKIERMEESDQHDKSSSELNGSIYLAQND